MDKRMKGKKHRLAGTITGVVSSGAFALIMRLSVRQTFVFFTLFCALCLLGSVFPDIDIDAGLRYHRSPAYHSFLPALPFLGCLWLTRDYYVGVVTAGFCMGLGTHLIGDTKWKGNIWESIRRTPGDIRLVPEEMEAQYLFINFMFSVVASVVILGFARAGYLV
jgi:hypothetical protein